MNDLLRERLQEISDSGNDWPTAIAALHSECPHSIREVHPAQPGRYNCFAFALGLHQSRNYLLVARRSNPQRLRERGIRLTLDPRGLGVRGGCWGRC
jgi:hypothetical protein